MNDIKEWCVQTGLFPVSQPELTVESVIKFSNTPPDELTLDALQHVITQTIAYNIYLKSIKGTLMAQMTAADEDYKRKLGVETFQFETKGRFTTTDEKVAMVLQTNTELKTLHEKLTNLRMKYNRIKDIPQALDIAIDNFKSVLMRKVNESKQQ